MESQWLQQHRKQLNAESMLLPWPSFGWQQAALAAAVALGLGVAVAGIVALANSGTLIWPLEAILPTPLAAVLAGLLVTGLALHGGFTTQWLNGTQEAPFAGKVTAGVAIGITIAAALAAFAVLLALLVFLAAMAIGYALLTGVPLSMGGGSSGNRNVECR